MDWDWETYQLSALFQYQFSFMRAFYKHCIIFIAAAFIIITGVLKELYIDIHVDITPWCSLDCCVQRWHEISM